MNHIKKINEFEYEEEVENKILSKWNDKITRIHTFTHIEWFIYNRCEIKTNNTLVFFKSITF